MKPILTILAVIAMTVCSAAQEKSKPADNEDSMKACPMHEQHQAAMAEHSHGKDGLDRRGAQGMGFAQDKTTHHFLLHQDGGAIQVTANSSGDKASVEEIQMHLQHIAGAFQSGDFDVPMFVHDQTPPGVPVMRKLKSQIKYRYDKVGNGGQVVITSDNAAAVQAIHEFLKFQITEHQTGDALTVR
ncbi:MAG TPA: hypothetical protein VFT65_13270 [Candidatus Angelobacter sp.]|nr:hypothetical protein [Candidatus Angelobacter sp.]